MDGAESHTHSEFVRVCYSKNILPFCLPPHTTHLLQLLDVVCFQPLKHYHSEAIDAKVWLGDAKFSKVEFLARITTIQKQAFKKNTILSSFRKTGLIPLNPSIVLNKLREFEGGSRVTSEPSLQLNPSTPERFFKEFFFTTPVTLKQLKLHSEALTNSDYSPSSRKIIQEKYVKGSLAKAGSGELAEDELKGVRKAEIKQAARRKSTNRVVQKGGVITVGKARQDIASRKANEVLVANWALIRAQKAAHQAVGGPWLNFLKEGNAFRMIIKKDAKARKQTLVLLFRELKEFVKKGKFSDTPLSVTVGWPALHLRCSAFCWTCSPKITLR